jgi:hypothetical protein
MMTSATAIVAYLDIGNSNYGTSCPLSLSGTTITVGTPVVFASASTNYASACMMDSTHAIVAYTNSSNSDYGTACALTIS